MSLWRQWGVWITLVLVLAVGVWPAVTQQALNREIAFTILMFAALASSLNILLGYTGYVSFGHIVFFGMGGYIGMWLMNTFDVHIAVAVLAGGAGAGLLAFLLGKAILRLRGAYFALATIGVNQAARSFVNNFDLFGGATGISLNFSIYNGYGGAMQALWMAYWVLLGLTVLAVILSFVVQTSKFGLGLLAIRENEDAAEVMGVVTPNAKTWAYVLSAVIPGMVGVLFFFKNGNIEPGDAFRLHTSIETIVMVMLGGQGTLLGPVVGAAIYQWMRGFLLTNEVFKDVQLAVAGVFLLVIILFIPAGLVGALRKFIPGARRVLS